MPTNYVPRPAPIDKGKVGGKTADASSFTNISKAIAIGNTSQTKVGLPVKFSGNANTGAIASNRGVATSLARTSRLNQLSEEEVYQRLLNERISEQVAAEMSGATFRVVLLEAETQIDYTRDPAGIRYGTYLNFDDKKLYYGRAPFPANPVNFPFVMTDSDFDEPSSVFAPYARGLVITLGSYGYGTTRQMILDDINGELAQINVDSDGESGQLVPTEKGAGTPSRLSVELSRQGTLILRITGKWYGSLTNPDNTTAYVGIFFGSNSKNASTLFGLTSKQENRCGVSSSAMLIPAQGTTFSCSNQFANDKNTCIPDPILNLKACLQILSGATIYVLALEDNARVPGGAGFPPTESSLYRIVVSRYFGDFPTISGNILYKHNLPGLLVNGDTFVTPLTVEDITRYGYMDYNAIGNTPQVYLRYFLRYNKGTIKLRQYGDNDTFQTVITDLNNQLSAIDVTPTGESGTLVGTGRSKLVASVTPDYKLRLDIVGQWYDKPFNTNAGVGLFFPGGPPYLTNPSTVLGVTNANEGCGVAASSLLIPPASFSTVASFKAIPTATIDFTYNPCALINPGGGRPNNSPDINNQPLSNGCIQALSGASFHIFCSNFIGRIVKDIAMGRDPNTGQYTIPECIGICSRYADYGFLVSFSKFRQDYLETRPNEPVTLPWTWGNNSNLGISFYKKISTVADGTAGVVKGMITLPLIPLGSSRNHVLGLINAQLSKYEWNLPVNPPGRYPIGDPTPPYGSSPTKLTASLTSDGKLRLDVIGPWYDIEALPNPSPAMQCVGPQVGLVFQSAPYTPDRNGSTALGIAQGGGNCGTSSEYYFIPALMMSAGQRSVIAPFIIGDENTNWNTGTNICPVVPA
jgi:hypothetical protein